MNCAMVTIGDKEGTSRHTGHAEGFKPLPEIFVANVNGEGKCITIESEDVGFPLPI